MSGLRLAVAGRVWSIGRDAPDGPILLRISLHDEAEARAVAADLMAAWLAEERRPSDPESDGRSPAPSETTR